jgi:hypothetical protein
VIALSKAKIALQDQRSHSNKIICMFCYKIRRGYPAAKSLDYRTPYEIVLNN